MIITNVPAAQELDELLSARIEDFETIKDSTASMNKLSIENIIDRFGRPIDDVGLAKTKEDLGEAIHQHQPPGHDDDNITSYALLETDLKSIDLPIRDIRAGSIIPKVSTFGFFEDTSSWLFIGSTESSSITKKSQKANTNVGAIEHVDCKNTL
jgi:hypothetical protein